MPVILLLVVLFGESLSALGPPDMTIEQLRGVFFAPQQSLLLEARITDVTGIVAARCYFRYQPATDYVYVELDHTGEHLYRATLPAPAQAVQDVDYFFLAVNRARQVVRSSSYTLNRGTQSPAPWDLDQEVIAIRSEGPVPANFAESLARPGSVRIEAADANERFGLVAGVYPAFAFPGAELAEGYFGGFQIDAAGQPVPVKGLADFASPVHALKPSTATASGASPVTGIVGPDIAGEWSGVTYTDDDGVHSLARRLTAVITQVGEQVTIDTSLPEGNRPQHLVGIMNADGHMLLYDEVNEDWSTHYGPATSTELTIGDYTVPPSDEDTSPPILVIELQRKLPPPPPPNLFLPAVYKLLLPQAPK